MKTVLVLGNARSGTSMTAGILFYLGVDIRHENQPSEQNPHGGFESAEFNNITTQVHKSFLDGSIDEKREFFLKSLRRSVENNKQETWGWKSALTHWHLDFFAKEVENPHLVIVTRNVYHNAISWKKHMANNYGKNVSVNFALETVTKGQLALVKEISRQNYPCIWTTYEDIKKDPLSEAQKIAIFLGIDFTDRMKQNISEFIIPNYTTIKDSNG